MNQKIHIVVLGAGGRVGSVLLRHLSSDTRFSAVGICRNAVIAGPLRLAGLQVRCGTVRDRQSADELIGRPDVIVNCAVDAGWASTAREANRRLLRAVGEIPDVKRFIQFSSVGVYGSCIDRGRATFDRPRPYARYAEEKIHQERAALRYARPDRTTFLFRMGHVYGPYQGLSRSIFEFLQAEGPELPFDGRIASNAVYIESVCRAVAWVASEYVTGGTYNLVDRPQRTWRELVDWHAGAIGAPSLKGMDPDRSARLARRCRRMESVPLVLQLAHELAVGFASVASSLVGSSPTAIILGQRIVGSLRSPRIEAILRTKHALTRAQHWIALGPAVLPPAWLLSDEAPGPVLPYPSMSPSAADQRAIADWYHGYASPPPIDEAPAR